MKHHNKADRVYTCGASRGAVMVEYIMVITFFMMVVWYALVGTEPLSQKTGEEGTGLSVDLVRDNPTPYLGLRHALTEKQKTFQDRLYQP